MNNLYSPFSRRIYQKVREKMFINNSDARWFFLIFEHIFEEIITGSKNQVVRQRYTLRTFIPSYFLCILYILSTISLCKCNYLYVSSFRIHIIYSIPTILPLVQGLLGVVSKTVEEGTKDGNNF